MLDVSRSLNKCLWKSGLNITLCHQPECSNINYTKRAKSLLFGLPSESGREPLATIVTKVEGILLHINGLKLALCFLCR